jgi:hypothetical protein
MLQARMISHHARSSWRRVPLPPATGILYPWSFEICSQFYANSTMHPVESWNEDSIAFDPPLS